MKSNSVSIQIPSPCHESWDKMQLNNQGKFCGSCQKTVIDFTGKSDVEIRNLLLAHTGEKVCGHFKKTQVGRPLQLTIDLTTLPRNMLPVRAFAIALLLTFGTTLISCYDHKGTKINAIQLNTTSKNGDVRTTMGEALTYETEDSLSKKSLLKVEVIENADIKDDLILKERIMGKIAFREEPIDSLVDARLTDGQGEIKICYPQDTLIEDPVIENETITGGLAMMVTQEERNENDSTLNSEELKTALNNTEDIPENNFRIYPNPSRDEFNMQYTLLKPSDVQVHVFNMDGRLVQSPINIKSQHSGEYHIPLNLTEESAGVYVIAFIENGKKSTQRVIITN